MSIVSFRLGLTQSSGSDPPTEAKISSQADFACTQALVLSTAFRSRVNARLLPKNRSALLERWQ